MSAEDKSRPMEVVAPVPEAAKLVQLRIVAVSFFIHRLIIKRIKLDLTGCLAQR